MQRTKPQLSFWQIWNMCFGFLGLRSLFGGAPLYALVLGGVSFVVAGLLVLRVPRPVSISQPA
jgi:hypothetical protein